MRRGLTAVIGTVAGTALLVGAKLGDLTGASAAADPTATVDMGDAPPTSVSPIASGRPGPSQTAKPGANPKPTASAIPPTGTPRPRASSAPPPPPSSGLHNGTFAGPGVSEKFGAIKVTIVVSGGRINDVSATCSCSGRSASISDNAFAKLEPRVLTAQSANVQSVSGATYTYEAYKQSLAAAINSAKA